MLKTLTIAGGMLIAGLSLSAAPASAASIGTGALGERSSWAETVQFDRRDRGYGERRGVRPGRVVRRLLGVGPRPGYRDRRYGYGRRDGYGRGYNR